jgi:hypothetical protein
MFSCAPARPAPTHWRAVKMPANWLRKPYWTKAIGAARQRYSFAAALRHLQDSARRDYEPPAKVQDPLPSWNDGPASVPYGSLIFLGQGWWPAACPSCRPGCIQIGAGVPSSLPPVVRGWTDPKSCAKSSRPGAKSFTPNVCLVRRTRFIGSRVEETEARINRKYGNSLRSL